MTKFRRKRYKMELQFIICICTAFLVVKRFSTFPAMFSYMLSKVNFLSEEICRSDCTRIPILYHIVCIQSQLGVTPPIVLCAKSDCISSSNNKLRDHM